ncbi:MAG: hypothetical protein R3A50_07055 [Saprospiraceae bacterium]
MKKGLTYVALLSALFFASTAFGQRGLRMYPFKDKSTGFSGGKTDSTLYFGASISFDLFVRESGTGSYKIGAIPGVGYGFRWNPKWNPLKTKSVISFDLFTQANLAEEIDMHSGFDYFSIDLLPVVTFFDWIGIGYGPRFKVGLDGVPSTRTGIFSFGIRKGL